MLRSQLQTHKYQQTSSTTTAISTLPLYQTLTTIIALTALLLLLFIMLAQSQSFSTSFRSRRISEPGDVADYYCVPELSGLVLPATIECGDLLDDAPTCSGGTVVSTYSSDEDVLLNAASPRSRLRKSSSTSSSSSSNDAVTHPVPEFLCHLFTMLRDSSIDHLISWEVPYEDEPDHLGGGIRGIGKIVVLDPERLQDHVLGNYYRHCKYASFQRQLNYFGFKKRLHNGKKGKLSPCSYIHEGLTADVESLLGLKRRPPAKKRSNSEDSDSEDMASSRGKTSRRSKKLKSSKRRRTDKKSKKSSKKVDATKQHVITTNKPTYVNAEEYPHPPTRPQQQQHAPTSLNELLSSALPPSDVLFNDDETDYGDDGYWVTDNGMTYVHDVDIALVNLAMFY